MACKANSFKIAHSLRNMNAASKKVAVKKTILFAIIVFFLAAFLSLSIVYQRYHVIKKEDFEKLIKKTESIKDHFQEEMAKDLSVAKTLAFIVKNYGIPNDFDSIAKLLLRTHTNIDAIELTQKGVITHVYPYKGNEPVIGYDILSDSKTNKEALKAIEKNKLYFAGPINLKQGGIGIVGRLPIKINGKFFGFSVVLIKLNTLFKAVGINDGSDPDFVYQVSKLNPNTGQEEFFLNNSIQNNTSSTYSVTISEGDWIIYVKLKTESAFRQILPFIVISLLFSLACGVLGWYFAREPHRLEQVVNEKSAKITEAENNFKNVMERVSDAVIALDVNGNYVYLNDEALLQHTQGRDQTIGKNIWEVHPALKETAFYNKYHEALATTKVQELEWYYAPIKTWFNAKMYPATDGITIFYRNITKQKNTELEILHEKTLSDSIINSLPGIFYLMNTEGEFVRWNKNFEIISNYTAQEIKEMRLTDFFDKQDNQLIIHTINRVLDNGSAEIETNLINKSGEKIPYYINGYFQKIYNHDYIIGVGMDISERKKLEDLVQRANILAKIGHWEIDLINNTVYWSDITREIHEAPENYTPALEEAIKFYKEGSIRDLIMQKATDAIEKGISWDEELPILTYKNNERWVRTIGDVEFKNGKCIKLYGSFQDIHFQKKAEISLARSEAFNRGILKSLNSQIAVLNSNGVIVEVNDAWNQFSLQNGEFDLNKTSKGSNYFDVCIKALEGGDESAGDVLKGMKQVLSGELNSFYYEYPCHSPEHLRWFSLSVVKFSSQEDMIVVSHENISDRKLAEQEREKMTRDLIQRNKNMEQFSYMVSHNLRAPLTNILGLTEVLKLKNLNEEELSKVMSGVYSAAVRLDEVIKDMNEILTIKNQTFNKKETVAFENLVTDILLSIDKVIKEININIETDFKAVDRMQSVKPYLYSIFYNLIYNSIKYRKTSGPLYISIRSELKDQKIKLYFRDNGLGIDVKKYGHSLFGMYKRFHLHTEGKGLGLFMIKTQVEVLGGSISVESEVNHWTEFCIEFPA